MGCVRALHGAVGVVVLLALVIVQPAVVLGIGRWWAVGLVLLLPILAIPVPTPEDAYEPLPMWFAMFYFGILVCLVLIAAGVAVRKGWNLRRPHEVLTVRLVALVTLGVLVIATIYEALVAVGVIGLGSQPGDGPPGERTVLLIAVGAMLVAAGLNVLTAVGARVPFVELLAPAAAVFLLARFYTFDPYYLPTLRRMSDQGMLPPGLVYGVAALAVGAASLTRAHRRVGAALSVPVVLVCALLAQVAAGGH